MLSCADVALLCARRPISVGHKDHRFRLTSPTPSDQPTANSHTTISPSPSLLITPPTNTRNDLSCMFSFFRSRATNPSTISQSPVRAEQQQALRIRGGGCCTSGRAVGTRSRSRQTPLTAVRVRLLSCLLRPLPAFQTIPRPSPTTHPAFCPLRRATIPLLNADS